VSGVRLTLTRKRLGRRRVERGENVEGRFEAFMRADSLLARTEPLRSRWTRSWVAASSSQAQKSVLTPRARGRSRGAAGGRSCELERLGRAQSFTMTDGACSS